MFARFSLLLLIAMPLFGLAQNGPEGYIRIVIATGTEGKVSVLWDGEDVQPGGYASGTATGVVGFAAGVHKLHVKHDTLGEATFPVQLMPNTGKNLIIYLERETKKTEGDDKKSKLKLAVLDMVPGRKSRSLCLFALPSAQDVKATAGDQQATLKPFEVSRLDFKGHSRNVFKVALNSVEVTYVRFDADAGEQAVLCFPDATGTIKFVKFDNSFD